MPFIADAAFLATTPGTVGNGRTLGLGTSPKEVSYGLLESSPDAGRHPRDRHVVNGYSSHDHLQ